MRTVGGKHLTAKCLKYVLVSHGSSNMSYYMRDDYHLGTKYV